MVYLCRSTRQKSQLFFCIRLNLCCPPQPFPAAKNSPICSVLNTLCPKPWGSVLLKALSATRSIARVKCLCPHKPLRTFASDSIFGAPTPWAASMWTPPLPVSFSFSAASRNHDALRFLESSAVAETGENAREKRGAQHHLKVILRSVCSGRVHW